MKTSGTILFIEQGRVFKKKLHPISKHFLVTKPPVDYSIDGDDYNETYHQIGLEGSGLSELEMSALTPYENQQRMNSRKMFP